MKLKLIYGRSGTGKSTYIYNDIKQKLETLSYGEKIFVIVPEQCNLSAERNIFDITGKKSLINVEVLTLSRMAYRVLAEVGKNTTSLSKIGKSMLIYDLLTKEKRNLKFLGKSEKNIDIVDRMFTEFKKHNVSIDILKNNEIKDEYTKLKLEDITNLYERYEEKLANNFIDENDELSLLEEYIEESKMFDNAYIYIDEFLGFTAQEYKIFRKLIKCSKEITVGVATDNLDSNTSKEKDIFYFNKKYANKLLEIASEENAEIQKECLDTVVRFKNEELTFLEKNFDKYKSEYNGEIKNINLFLANNPYTEIEYIAQKIHNLVKKCGYKYNQIGIITENIEQYSEDVKSIFAKYEIPVFIDEKKELNQNILIQFVVAMLEIFSKNFSYDSVFNYLKIGLLNIDLENIFRLENYCIKWGIKGAKWQREFNYEPLNDKQEELEALRQQIINPLINFKEEVSKNKTVLEITKGLYRFLEENHIPENLDIKLKKYNNIEISDEYNTSYKLLINVLEEMCVLFKDERFGFEKYKEMFQVGLNVVELGKLPATQDQVVLGDTERTRSHKLKVVFMIGANDGSFPKVNKVEGYLNDSDRAILKDSGIELAKDSIDSLFEEQFNIYRSLTTPEDMLFVSYSSSDKEGKSIRPSILIKKLKKLFVNLKEDSDVIVKKHIVTNYTASFEEALEVYKECLEGKEIDSKWVNAICYFYNKDKERFEKALEGMGYSNKAEEITKENIDALYGSTLYTSVSRLEAYRRCPFSFHLTYGLKLKEKDELKMNFLDTGSFMHEVIDIFFKELSDRDILVKDIEESKIEEITKEIMDNILSSSKYYTFSSTAKFRLLTNRLRKVVVDSIKYIVYTLKHSDFSVFGHEVEFGNKGEFKPIEIKTENKNIVITGKIDRVDTAKLADKQYVRIVDYKSSIKDLDMNQVMSGLQIQLITYLDAMSEQEEVEPSGILYLGLIDNIVKSEKNLSEEEIANRIRKNFKMKGLILADISVIKLMDNHLESGYSDIIPAYITKDGEISESRSSVIYKNDFEKLTSKVKNIIKDISKEILKGKIDIMPYYYRKKTGCDYCKYQTICNFNCNFKNNDYFYIKNKEKSLILEELRENK